jgi:integrase
MSQEQLEKLLAAAEGWSYDFIYIAAFTGVRRGDLLTLRWQDVNLKDKSIQIRQSVSKLSWGRLVFREPKTKSSIRLISIDDDIIKILKSMSVKCRQTALKHKKQPLLK